MMANRCQFLKLGSSVLVTTCVCDGVEGVGCVIGVKSKVRLCMSCGHDRVAHASKSPNSQLYEFRRLAMIDKSNY